jgi:hypothetical protein
VFEWLLCFLVLAYMYNIIVLVLLWSSVLVHLVNRWSIFLVVYCSLVRHHNDTTQPCFKLKSPCHVSHDFIMVKCTILIDLKKKKKNYMMDNIAIADCHIV